MSRSVLVLVVWSTLSAPLAAQLTPCKVPGLDEEVRCATVPVWENRAARSGRKIDLNVVVLPALSEHPAPDPVVYLSGGPGYGSAGAAGGFAEFLPELRKTRDILLLDQRGTGRSHASERTGGAGLTGPRPRPDPVVRPDPGRGPSRGPNLAAVGRIGLLDLLGLTRGAIEDAMGQHSGHQTLQQRHAVV